MSSGQQNAVTWAPSSTRSLAACRTTSPRSSRAFLHHARPRSQRSEPTFDWDSARGRHRGGHCLSAGGGDESVVGLLERSDCRCWRFSCCLSRHWSIGFRHSVRVPADLRARWLFHLIRPADHSAYMAGVRRAAVVKLVVPVLLALTAVTRSRVRPANGDRALHIRVAQRARARARRSCWDIAGCPLHPVTFRRGRDDLRWYLRVHLLDWRVHGGMAGAPGAEHHARHGRSLCRHRDHLCGHPWNGHVAAARSSLKSSSTSSSTRRLWVSRNDSLVTLGRRRATTVTDLRLPGTVTNPTDRERVC